MYTYVYQIMALKFLITEQQQAKCKACTLKCIKAIKYKYKCKYKYKYKYTYELTHTHVEYWM